MATATKKNEIMSHKIGYKALRMVCVGDVHCFNERIVFDSKVEIVQNIKTNKNKV